MVHVFGYKRGLSVNVEEGGRVLVWMYNALIRLAMLLCSPLPHEPTCKDHPSDPRV